MCQSNVSVCVCHKIEIHGTFTVLFIKRKFSSGRLSFWIRFYFRLPLTGNDCVVIRDVIVPTLVQHLHGSSSYPRLLQTRSRIIFLPYLCSGPDWKKGNQRVYFGAPKNRKLINTIIRVKHVMWWEGCWNSSTKKYVKTICIYVGYLNIKT